MNRQMIRSQRNYGIDLLRIVSQFYVVFAHAIGQGGILHNLTPGTHAHGILWAMQICANSAPNIFILISGYTSISAKESKNNFSKLVLLWLEILFYNVGVFLLYHLIFRQAVIPSEFLKTFFPITNTTYWYFSIFFGFSVIKPLLDKGIREMNEKLLKKLFYIIVCIFVIYPVIYGGFGINDGFSVIWFIVLYSLGAIAKKCRIGESLSSVKSFSAILLLILITWIWKMYGFEFQVLGKTIDTGTLLPYASPTVAGIGFFHILGYAKLKTPQFLDRVIRFAAPSAFAVYILNTHPSYWHNILKDQFLSLSTRRISVILPRVMLYAILFVTAAVLIDKLRQILFKKLQLQERISRAADHFTEI